MQFKHTHKYGKCDWVTRNQPQPATHNPLSLFLPLPLWHIGYLFKHGTQIKMRFSGSQKVPLPYLSLSLRLAFTFRELLELVLPTRLAWRYPELSSKRLKNFVATTATTTTTAASTANVSEQTTAAHCYTFSGSSSCSLCNSSSSCAPPGCLTGLLPQPAACCPWWSWWYLFALRLMRQLYLCSAARRDRESDCDYDWDVVTDTDTDIYIVEADTDIIAYRDTQIYLYICMHVQLEISAVSKY